jgi:hypothetical protein
MPGIELPKNVIVKRAFYVKPVYIFMPLPEPVWPYA